MIVILLNAGFKGGKRYSIFKVLLMIYSAGAAAGSIL